MIPDKKKTAPLETRTSAPATTTLSAVALIQKVTPSNVIVWSQEKLFRGQEPTLWEPRTRAPKISPIPKKAKPRAISLRFMPETGLVV